MERGGKKTRLFFMCIKNIRICLSIQGKAVPLQADYYQ